MAAFTFPTPVMHSVCREHSTRRARDGSISHRSAMQMIALPSANRLRSISFLPMGPGKNIRGGGMIVKLSPPLPRKILDLAGRKKERKKKKK
jgi:hypothetical protein